MTRLDVLELLKELIGPCSIGISKPDDPSGMSTRYYVDHEQLMSYVEEEIKKEEA